MKHASDIIWKLALSLVGLAIGIQIFFAFIAPYKNWIFGVLALLAVVWLIGSGRRLLNGGNQKALRRGNHQ